MNGLRRFLSVISSVFLLCGFFGSASLFAGEVRKPNVLLIVADDVGVGDLRSFYPAATTSTPNLDNLAAHGMRFTRFYTDSTCSASRAALLTGQHPARLGFHTVARGIAPEVVTMADWLSQQGYSTHQVGKWHIGELYAAAKPVAQGFDSSFGFMNQWFLQGPDDKGEPVLRHPVYQDPWLETDTGVPRQYLGYLPDILADYAVRKIEALAAQRQPWFVYFATPLSHTPLHAPPDMPGNVATATDDEKYRAMIAHMDKNIGAVVHALDVSGQRDNTLIIFVSDNGAPEKREGSNAELGGGKSSYSEGGVRAPLLWVDGSNTLPGSLDERAVYIADIFPALAARIGAPLPFETDGLDFNDLANWALIRTRQLFWLSRESYSVLSADKVWRLTESWVFREFKALRLLEIKTDHVEDSSIFRWFYTVKIKNLQKDVAAWLGSVSRTGVKINKQSAVIAMVSGNDFLRTPLKEWDFYVAVSLPVGVVGDEEQMIAEQAGVWSLSYAPSAKQLLVRMHGHEWRMPLGLSEQCSLIGLNADIYDKYTNLSNSIRPTALRLSVDGEEKGRTEWQIESLLHVDVSAPTRMGISASGAAQWKGDISSPVFYHRANVIGEWPYFVDEVLLRNTLCAELKVQ